MCCSKLFLRQADAYRNLDTSYIFLLTPPNNLPRQMSSAPCVCRHWAQELCQAGA